MRRPYHPDDSGMTWQDGGGNRNRNGNGHGGGNRGGYKAPDFIRPAETRALAEDMADEFGGSEKAWRRDLNWQPQTFNFGGGHGGGGGGGNGGGPGGPGNGGGNNGGFDPSSPRNRSRASIYDPSGYRPDAMGMGAMVQSPMQTGMGPRMQMQHPGLLAGPMQAQQPNQQQGLLGPIPPEVLAYISGNVRR